MFGLVVNTMAEFIHKQALSLLLSYSHHHLPLRQLSNIRFFPKARPFLSYFPSHLAFVTPGADSQSFSTAQRIINLQID